MERLNNLFKFTQLVNDRVRVQVQPTRVGTLGTISP